MAKSKKQKKKKASLGEISFSSAKELKSEGENLSKKKKKSSEERMLDELFSERKRISY